MKRILYYSPQIFIECDGVTKKTLAQVDAMRAIGHIVDVIYLRQNDYSCRLFFNEQLLEENAYSGKMYQRIIEKLNSGNYDYLFVRYVMLASRAFNHFLRDVKSLNVKILAEIPTYPYDGELNFSISKTCYRILRERFYRSSLYKYIDYFITTSEEQEIFHVKTINISNAPAYIPPIHKHGTLGQEMRIVAVANIAFWHGYDRIIKGMHIYYTSNPKIKLKLQIVGDGNENVLGELKELVEKYKLSDCIQFVGPKNGGELDNIFDGAVFAVGCLGCHRKGVTEVKSLKNVEYAMRGMLFGYSENNTDFDGKPYVLKFKADDTPIDIASIVDFVQNQSITAEEISSSVSDMTWENQFKKVFQII